MATGWRVRWDDVEAVAPQDAVRVPTRGPDGALGVDTRHLPVDAETMPHLPAAHVQPPELRPRLGTATSLAGLRRSV